MKKPLLEVAQGLLDEVPEIQVREWKEHSVTKILLMFLEGTHEGIKDSWADGSFTGESSEATAQLNSRALGYIQGFNAVAMLVEDIGEPKDEETTEGEEDGD